MTPEAIGGEDVVEQVLELGHFLELAGVFDGDGGLVGEGGQQVALALAEQAGADAVIDVDDAGDLPAELERDADDGAQVVAHHALLGGEARVGLGVGGDDRLAAGGDLLDDGAADLEGGAGERFALDVARDAELQLALRGL